MTRSTPEYTIPLRPATWLVQQDYLALNWDAVPALSPFYLFDGSAPATQQTVVRLCCDQQALYARFDCVDDDIWGTLTERDEPIYEEEVVELFLAAGAAQPTRYYEFEISPNGVFFDAAIFNPHSTRATMIVDTAWDCRGVRWQAVRVDQEKRWSAVMAIPWAALTAETVLPPVWRANFYRIERPRQAPLELSCWSPTMISPPDFHQPAYFGTLHLPPELKQA
jgi:Carbohydrate-binding family 9